MTPEHGALLERMRTSVAVVRRAVAAVPEERLRAAPAPGEWSALETLVHLAHVVVHVYGLRIRRLLYEDAPVFADFDEPRYREETLVRGDSADELVAIVAGEQEQLARLLRLLPDDQWARAGRHPTLGVMSIEFLARRVGEHAEEHAAQITAAGRG
ncbi:MAG TPA: DinB family protein [Methylomirabilota bacterium]|jgi:hypothetical protein